MPHPGVAEDGGAAKRRLVRVDRQVDAAGEQNPEHGGDLLDALVHHDRDPVTGGDPAGPQRVGDGGGAAGQLAVGRRAPAVDDREAVRGAACLVENRLVQEEIRRRSGGVVDSVTLLGLPAGQRDDVLGLPSPSARGEAAQQILERGEHVVHQPVREDAVANVPVDPQAPFVIHGLAVDVHLRGLGDAVSVETTGGGTCACSVAADADGAGEHDRHQCRLAAAPARELADHLDARVQPVIEVVEKPVADRAGPLGERPARGPVDLQ